MLSHILLIHTDETLWARHTPSSIFKHVTIKTSATHQASSFNKLISFILWAEVSDEVRCVALTMLFHLTANSSADSISQSKWEDRWITLERCVILLQSLNKSCFKTKGEGSIFIFMWHFQQDTGDSGHGNSHSWRYQEKESEWGLCVSWSLVTGSV